MGTHHLLATHDHGYQDLDSSWGRERLLILVNKMDLVGWSEHTFTEVVRTFSAANLKTDRAYILPISSLKGDNILGPLEGYSWMNDQSASHPSSSVHVSERSLMDLLR